MNLYELLNNNDEYYPNDNCVGWENYKNFKIMSSNIVYTIDNLHLLRQNDLMTSKLNVKKNSIVNFINYFETNYNKFAFFDDSFLIYSITNSDNSIYIDTLNISLISFIKYHFLKYFLKQVSIFDFFENSTSFNFRFEIIEFVKGSNKEQLEERKNLWQSLLTDDQCVPIKNIVKKKMLLESSDSLKKTDKKYAKRISILENIVRQFEDYFNIQYIYIYLFVNKVNNKSYVTCSNIPITVSDVLRTNLNEDFRKDFKKLLPTDFDFTKIDCFKSKIYYDLHFRLDYYKNKYDTINNGYNKNYCFKSSEHLYGNKFNTSHKKNILNLLFLKVNRLLFEKNYVDDTDYTNIYGYVFLIEHQTGKKYFGNTFGNTLKQLFLNFYDKIIGGNIKHDKFLKSLQENKFDEYQLSIYKVKKHDDYITSLEKETQNLIRQFDTINTGYNIDNSKNKN